MTLELNLIDQQYFQISPYLAECLGVQDGESVWLYAGAGKCEVIIKINDNYPCMYLNKQWAADLNLTPGKWKIKRVPDGIRLGPIIGIVCKNLPNRPPAESGWSRYLGTLDSGLGILLTPDGFDQEHLSVCGLTLSNDKLHWVERQLPWPDALYVRTYPINTSLKTFLQTEFPFCHFNTKTLFDKWLVFQSLSRNQDIKPYLPETAILESEPASLQSWLKSDFHILMQKKNDGLWHITGIWGKRGAVGSIVNNLSGGGEFIPPARLLENGTIAKAQRMKEIYRLCLLAALNLEEDYGQLGEISLDLCIDKEEHLWILEVNGMPGKKIFTKFSSANVTKTVYSAPMLYATYLSGFSDVIYPLAK
jgi:hypothetical protein